MSARRYNANNPFLSQGRIPKGNRSADMIAHGDDSSCVHLDRNTFHCIIRECH